MSKNNKNKESRSMYLYTALIFVVALLLILLSFFSQTNISKLGKRADEFAVKNSAAPAATQSTSNEKELAAIVNMVPTLEKENKELQDKLTVYENLLKSNTHIANGNIADAETIFISIDEASLTDDQRILYEEIKTKINEGKEQ